MRGDVNLCSVERGVRLRKALLVLSVAIAQVIVLAELGAPPIWWATMIVPLLPTALLITQAYSGVCVFHARSGTRSMGGIIEPILDPKKLLLTRKKGNRVLVATLGLATSATAVIVALAFVRTHI